MEITNLSEDFIKKHRDKAFAGQQKHLYPKPEFAWKQGWEAAIRFAKKMEGAITICEQCGKVITDIENFSTDSEGVAFCAKCYDKLFKKEDV